ncbi:hypothetical protein K440DRAFT_619036 [Wilcoxina mikolae CBS 423.85]|nr:hypothetical protein K440DRAFT_619036 [Wilcoxina mikolae CBS 423.85]
MGFLSGDNHAIWLKSIPNKSSSIEITPLTVRTGKSQLRQQCINKLYFCAERNQVWRNKIR